MAPKKNLFTSSKAKAIKGHEKVVEAMAYNTMKKKSSVKSVEFVPLDSSDSDTGATPFKRTRTQPVPVHSGNKKQPTVLPILPSSSGQPSSSKRKPAELERRRLAQQERRQKPARKAKNNHRNYLRRLRNENTRQEAVIERQQEQINLLIQMQNQALLLPPPPPPPPSNQPNQPLPRQPSATIQTPPQVPPQRVQQTSSNNMPTVIPLPSTVKKLVEQEPLKPAVTTTATAPKQIVIPVPAQKKETFKPRAKERNSTHPAMPGKVRFVSFDEYKAKKNAQQASASATPPPLPPTIQKETALESPASPPSPPPPPLSPKATSPSLPPAPQLSRPQSPASYRTASPQPMLAELQSVTLPPLASMPTVAEVLAKLDSLQECEQQAEIQQELVNAVAHIPI